MADPILSISSAARNEGDDPTQLVEGGGTIAIKVTSNQAFTSSQQVMIELSGTATTNYGSTQSAVLSGLGEGVFAKFQLPEGSTSFKGVTQIGEGATSKIFAVVSRNEYQPATGTPREFIIQKLNADGSVDASFGDSGSKTISIWDNSSTSSDKLVFSADGSMAYQHGTNVQFFNAAGTQTNTFDLGNTSLRVLGLNNGKLFVQDSSTSGTDIKIYSASADSVSLVDQFSTTVNAQKTYFSGDVVSNQSDQYVLTSDGKLAWKDYYGTINVATKTDTGWNTSSLQKVSSNGSGTTIQNSGKFYTYDSSTGSLSVIDANTKASQTFNVDIAGKANLSSVNFVGVGDDGSILLSANGNYSPTNSTTTLPSGLNALFKLVPQQTTYSIDPSFGNQGVLLSTQSTNYWDVKASVGDTFLRLDGGYSTPDLNVWSNGTMGNLTYQSTVSGKTVLSLNLPSGTTEATFYVRANSDFVNESQEGIQFKLLPNTSTATGVMSPTPPATYSQTYSVDPNAGTVNLTVQDLRPNPGLDLNGPFEQGADHHGSGPYDYWSNGSGATATYNSAQPHFNNSTILPPVGTEVSQLKISVQGAGNWTGSTNVAEKFDLVFGYPNYMGAAQTYASQSSVNTGDFRVAINSTPTSGKYYFTQYIDGSNQLFTLSQTYNSTTQSYDFTIRSENGHGMSSQMASELLTRFGFAYHDQGVTAQHHVNLEVNVSAYDTNNTLIAPSGPDSNKANFEFINYTPEIHDAIFHGKYVELMFHAGPSAEINYDLADTTDDGYQSWRGQPDISRFQIKVNGVSDPNYYIRDVVQKDSVLLVLNQELPADAKVEISYSDPSTADDVYHVIQTRQGNDAASFTNFPAKYGQIQEVIGQVLPGAELGWNMGKEEQSYLDVDWDATKVVGKVISVGGGQAVAEFHVTGWQQNPNYVSTAKTGLQSDPSAELVFQATLSKTGWTPVVGADLPLSTAIGYDQGYIVYSFKTTLNTSSATWSSGMTPSAVTPHDLAVYTISGGVPFSYIASSGFDLANTSISGSAYKDFLGNPTSLGNMQINAGDGDDDLIGGFGDDRLNGGKGTDTVHVAGSKNDFLIQKTGPNTFTLTPKNLTNWDSGGTDQLVSIEKVQFEDGTITLDSADPKSTTTVTAIATNATTVVQPSGEGFDYLDLTPLTINSNGTSSNVTYTLESGYNTNSGSIFVTGTTQSYEFAGFEGYIVSGSAKSSIADASYNPISINTLVSENDIVLVKSGKGLEIDLGDDVGSKQDVLSFKGTNAGVTIDLEPLAGSSGKVTFTTADGTSRVTGADIVFGSNANDTITGFDNKSNVLAGYEGNDVLTGGAQSDLLFGGAGADTLDGGAGNDVLIDLDKASLTGGAGKDQFVVRGAPNADAAQIKDLELSPEGLSRGGVNAQTFADRIIFNFSTAAFANSSISSTVSGATGTLSATEYLKLRNAIELKVEPNPASSTSNFVVSAYLKEAMSVTDSSAGLLGRVEFTTAGLALSATESIRAVKLAQSTDFLSQGSISPQVMDQMLSLGSPLTATASPTTEPAQVFTDTVSLVFGLEKTDKFTVSPQPGEHPPILIPVQINGVEHATKFQLGNANEQVIGSHAGDTYQFVQSSFIDANGTPEANQTFGNDVIIERGRPVDAVQVAVTQPPSTVVAPTPVAFDNTGRDVISMANENTNTGLSIHDLLVGDLNLVRMQKGREGVENSLKVTYHDSTPDVSSLNDVNVTVYKQYYAQDASFRVEDLQLLDSQGVATRYDLGQSFKDDTSQGLTTYDARDAILLARTAQADTFKLVNTATGEPDHTFDVFLKNFSFTDSDSDYKDKIQIEGYGQVIGQSPVTSENGDSKLTLTLDNGTAGAGATADDYTVNLYFLDTNLPSADDQLLWLKTV